MFTDWLRRISRPSRPRVPGALQHWDPADTRHSPGGLFNIAASSSRSGGCHWVKRCSFWCCLMR